MVLWDPTSHIIIMERDVLFDESSFIKSNIVKDEWYKAWMVEELYLEDIYFHECLSGVVKLVYIHVVLELVVLIDIELV